MSQQLSLIEANDGTFEVTTSNKASRHNLVVEPGDPLAIVYILKKRSADGTLSRWDLAPYTIESEANNPTSMPDDTTIIFANAKSSTLEDAVQDKLTVNITAAQTTQIGINDNFTWGIRFTETANTANTFTFLSGKITAKEDTVV